MFSCSVSFCGREKADKDGQAGVTSLGRGICSAARRRRKHPKASWVLAPVSGGPGSKEEGIEYDNWYKLSNKGTLVLNL